MRGAGTLSFGYDAAHERIKQVAPDGTTVYVNGLGLKVERFFARIGRNHRLAKDFEATVASARAFLYAASIMLLARRIARTQ